MCELVDQHQFRLARQNSVNIHFGQNFAAIFQRLHRQLRQTVDQPFGFPASMSIHPTDDDIQPFQQPLMRRLQHRVGFAHAGGCPQKNGKFPPGFFVDLFQDAVRVRPLFQIHYILHGILLLSRSDDLISL